MSRLVQYVDKGGQRRIAVASEDSSRLHPLSEVDRVYDLALESIRRGRSLESLIQSHVRGDSIDYEPIIREQRLLPPLDHRDPARCLVSLTGLTHVGSAKSRDEMHGAAATIPATDSIRMFDIGVAGGKPVSGKIGAQPEWAYKGDGRCVVPPEQPLTQPAFAAGLYVIDDNGTPWRVGYSIGNEFSDHLLERTNYLYLAHSKLRECSFGPELYVGELPDRVTGTVRVVRGEEIVWSGAFESGEANMCHSIANLEHHYFKYELFRRPGDVHVYFFGANSVSFGANIRTYDGICSRSTCQSSVGPLRNPLKVDRNDQLVRVRRL